MRAAFIAALVLMSSLAAVVPSAAAQQGAPFYEDPEGDTQLNTFGLPGAPKVPLANSETAPADLRALEVREDAETLHLKLTVAGLRPTLPYQVNYAIDFTWKKVEFTLNCGRSDLLGLRGAAGGWCYLNSWSEDAGWLEGMNVQGAWDVAAGTLDVPLPKVYILDEERRMPSRGDVLADVQVRSNLLLSAFGFMTQVRDAMPDQSPKSVTLNIGDIQKGHLRLTTQDRVRLSNGGATTFVFQANLSNEAELEDTVRLEASGLPEGWNITVQSPIRVPAQGSTRLAVLVSVPFAHKHGGHDAFNLTARSERDPASYASLRLGVLHTPIPQPAGHHSELYLHALSRNSGVFAELFPGARATMNTEAPTDQDMEEAMPSTQTRDDMRWEIPLEPALGMGLDFDVGKLGAITGALKGRVDGAADLAAALYLVPVEEREEFGERRMSYDLDDAVLLADGVARGLSLSMSGETPFEIPLTPTAESDYVPYAPRQNLVLVLTLRSEGMRTFCCLDGVTPSLMAKKFVMELPLNEYHDKLTGVAEAALAIDIKAEGPVEKQARPGSVMTYAFRLVNPLASAVLMDVDVAGSAADFGSVVPEGLVEVPAKGEVKITLAVRVPFEAEEGQELEVLVFAHAQDDPSKMAIARTKTIVTKGAAAMPDETANLLAAQQEAADNDTPAPGAALALAALAVVALALRRRRGA